MRARVKKAYEPGFIGGMLSDISQYLRGDPDFRSAYSNPELEEIFKVDPEGKTRGIYLDLVGILKHIGDKRKSEFKVTPREKKDITTAREHIKFLGMPSPSNIYSGSSSQILVKPIRFKELLSFKDTGNIYGFYYPGTDYIKLSRIIQENFKQSLGVATLVKQIGDNKINIPKEREPAIKRILYGAYLSSGFIPDLNINQFYDKVRTNKDFRSRYIKAMMYPAYFIALHEGIHKNTLHTEKGDSRYGYSMLYRNPESPFHSLYIAYTNGEISQEAAIRMYAMLKYVYNPAEIDAQLSSVKRWYQIQTGKNINTINEAKEAMEYISSLISRNYRFIDIVPSDVSNQYFAYNINKKLLRVMEDHFSKQYLEKGTDAYAEAYRDIRNARTTYLYRLAQL